MSSVKIWFDIATPKYALFFSTFIEALQKNGHKCLITTRFSENYQEAKKLLDMQGIEHEVVGSHGGATKPEKFSARMQRQSDFLKIFEKHGLPDLLIQGCVPDSVQTAFGLGIPIVSFSDTPIRGYYFTHHDITVVSKLTLPFSDLVFHPFVIPSEVFHSIGVAPEKVVPYQFIDVALWMAKVKADPRLDFRKKYGLPIEKPTILIREEEYKAHYVQEKLPVIYDMIPMLANEIDANLVIMPRYEKDGLKNRFGKLAFIIEEPLKPEEFYPFIQLLIGGGGTMNLEAAFLGVPVISTRSFFLFHDRYLIDHGLMKWVREPREGARLAKKLLGQKTDSAQKIAVNSEVAQRPTPILGASQNRRAAGDELCGFTPRGEGGRVSPFIEKIQKTDSYKAFCPKNPSITEMLEKITHAAMNSPKQ